MHRILILVSSAGLLITLACEPRSSVLMGPTSQPAVAQPAPSGLMPSALERAGGKTVLSGWDLAPVPGALVQIGADATTTDVNGAFSTSAPAGTAVDVTAPGYLPRKTRIGQAAITLWPAATSADVQAIRSMVFSGPSGDRLYPPARSYLITMVSSFQGTPDEGAVRAAWAREMEGMSTLTDTRFAFGPFEYDWSLQFEFRATQASCPSPWGFCKSWPHYRIIEVRPELAQDPVVIRRALAYTFLNGHNQPGILNIAQPMDSLSLLEEQTLKMLTLRAPYVNWPDTDPSRQ